MNQAESYQQLQREVINAVRDIEVSWRQLKLAERALELSKRKVNIEREKLGAGRSTNFQVLSYESDLRYAQSTHLDATLDYLDSQSALDHVVGSTLESWGVELND